MKWLEYFKDLQKQRAVSRNNTPLQCEYGNIIYQSGCFLGRRWLVTDFQGEFDVFVETEKRPHGSDRRFAAAFTNRDRAITFATEMFLVCCGKLQRRYTQVKYI